METLFALLLVMVAPAALGALVRYAIPHASRRVVFAPLSVIALGLWVILGWLGRGWNPELTTGGRVVILGLVLALELILFAIGGEFGRAVRRRG